MCDRVAQDEQIGLACPVAPAPLNYQSIWAWKQELEKGGELKEGRGCGAAEHQEGLSCLGSQPKQTAFPHPPQTQAALCRLTAFASQTAPICVWVKRLNGSLRDLLVSSWRGPPPVQKAYVFFPSQAVTTF